VRPRARRRTNVLCRRRARRRRRRRRQQVAPDVRGTPRHRSPRRTIAATARRVVLGVDGASGTKRPSGREQGRGEERSGNARRARHRPRTAASGRVLLKRDHPATGRPREKKTKKHVQRIQPARRSEPARGEYIRGVSADRFVQSAFGRALNLTRYEGYAW